MTSRPLFRVLRPDESCDTIRPSSSREPECSLNERVLEHVNHGSSALFESSLVSCTSELDVALAFGGILSKIAVIDQSAIPSDRVVYLDKEYLRRERLSDKQAHARSRRSDEVVVDGDLAVSSLLQTSIRQCERVLCPPVLLGGGHHLDDDGDDDDDDPRRVVARGAKNGKVLQAGEEEDDDGDFFPTAEEVMESGLEVLERIGGANKRLFRVRINGSTYCARSPRPNVCLDQPLLFGEDLVAMCTHEFASFCAYRRLTSTALVPRCALYTFDVEYSEVPTLLPRGGRFKWAVLLLEEISSLSVVEEEQSKIRPVAASLFAADLLLGNWGCCAEESLESLASDSSAIYATRARDGAVVRLGVDRALGCTYPEDKTKKRPDKSPVEFGADVLELKSYLLDYNKWLYGGMDARRVTQSVMDLRLDEPSTFESLARCADLATWPPFDKKNRERLEKTPRSVLGERRDSLLDALPFYRLHPPFCGRDSSSSSVVKMKKTPAPRDGHGAVGFADSNTMYVLGGNAKVRDGGGGGPSATNDVWMLDLKSGEWASKAPMPGPGRYSFSTQSWQSSALGHERRRYVVVFGGTSGPLTAHVLGDLLVYDVDADEWHVVDLPTKIPPRCRHMSTLQLDDGGTATMHLVGGFGARKLKDVWRVRLQLDDSPGGLRVRATCAKMQNLRKAAHRGYAFQFDRDERVFLIGGFGGNLTRVDLVRPPGQTITTLSSLDHPLPKSIAGFGAVLDATDKQVILLGGCGQANSGPRGGFGSGVGAAARLVSSELPFRILFLRRTQREDDGTEDWEWHINSDHELLDKRYRLPLKTSWSACILDHRVILFGGRYGDQFSDETIVLQLRPNLVAAVGEVEAMAKSINCRLASILQLYGPIAADDARKIVATALADSQA